MANTWILIRHPDKEGDKEGIYGGNTAKITDLGRQQMVWVIERLKQLGPTVVTCSMFERAYVLAQHISEELGIAPPVRTTLLNEIDKPQFLVGKKRSARLHQTVTRAIRRGWDANTVPTELLRGEKIRKRTKVERDIRRLIKMIETYQPSRIAPAPDVMLSVSHAKLIAAIGQMVTINTLKGFYEMFDRAFKVGTTGITILNRRPNRRTGKMQWEITTWNEEVHTDQLQAEINAFIQRI